MYVKLTKQITLNVCCVKLNTRDLFKRGHLFVANHSKNINNNNNKLATEDEEGYKWKEDSAAYYYYYYFIIIIIIIISLVTVLFFLVVPLNQRWSPPLRLQTSHCSTFRIMYFIIIIIIIICYYFIIILLLLNWMRLRVHVPTDATAWS